MADLFGTNPFSLPPTPPSGVTAQGAYVGSIPLLKRQTDVGGQQTWMPRPVSELNDDLSDHYGLPVDLSGKADGLAYVAGALNRGDVFRAQLAMQQMKLPSAAAQQTNSNSSGSGSGSGNNSRTGLRPGVIPAQELLLGSPWAEAIPQLPEGFQLPQGLRPFPNPGSTAPWRSPIPWDGAPPAPLDLPNWLGRYLGPLVNPYPERKKCVKEWAEAKQYCAEHLDELGQGDYRGQGDTYRQCVLGRVSEDCGGSPTGGQRPKKPKKYKLHLEADQDDPSSPTVG